MNESARLASVAICTLNRPSLLFRTLFSFLSVRIPPGLDWELIVVDNGPTGSTAEVVRTFAGRLPLRYVVEPRRGQSAARNRALSAYQGEFILWTDDDVEVDPEWIAATIEAFDSSQADIVFGRSFPVWEAGQPLWFSPVLAGLFALLDYGPESFISTDISKQFYGLNMAYRRSAAERLGGFREDLGYIGNAGGGADDTDMFERALGLGLKIVYTPASSVGHIIPPDRATKRRQRRLAWVGAPSNYRVVTQRFASLPQLFGLPRFLYRLAIDDALALGRHAIARNRTEAFSREIGLIRFAGLVKEAFQQLSSAPAMSMGRIGAKTK